ncbi:hypothetical protein HCC45_05150 [Streptococcus suis]|nr:hypothetical protein [Streptococcus suis]
MNKGLDKYEYIVRRMEKLVNTINLVINSKERF